MNYPGLGRNRRAVLALSMAIALLVVCLAVPSGAFAAPYNWSGGHDVAGWPEADHTLYFAEGTTRNGYEEYLFLRNPGPTDASVTVTYSSPCPEELLTQAVTLPAGAGASICVNHVVGHGGDVSIALESTTGIIAERQVYFNYKGIWTGGHVTSGIPEPSDTWYFAEGTTREGFQEWLCLQNPGDTDVTATITYMLGTGENLEESILLVARTRTTVDVNGSIGAGRDVSLVVNASGPIVAERPIYFDYKDAWRGGHNVAGSTELGREWYFAEGTTRHGFEEWLCILNPGDESTARIEYLYDDGPPLVTEQALGARSRTTVFVNEAAGPGKDVSIKVEADGDVLCERPMYFYYHSAWEGGHVVKGSRSGEDAWQFPTAAVGSGFEAWLCLMNPGSDDNRVTVEIFGDGDYRSQEISMGPYARSTVDLCAASEGIEDAWVKVTGEKPVVAERPVYFSYEPKVESEPFTFATWGGIDLKCPIRYCDLLGVVFHEAYPTGGDGKPDNPQVMQPVGICMQDDNPQNLCPGIDLSLGSDPAYFVESSRGRGTCSTSASDVVAKAGSPVFSPVNGTVIAAESYMLYGKYYDLRVRILIDGYPGYHMAVLHLDTLSVSVGQRVEAGTTQVGTVRDLTPYFNSAANRYSREAGNHPHIQINYRPDMGLGGVDSGGWMVIP
ncbi:MAG: M23 family metallopeptidase [Actinobacteria bacterium]|nr:M23 family metallopeptidase [Actinomycetota bacterium]MCG2818816.1 M23 family metallopeptidase [Actinomycetes bacterium]MBU4219235.1 M23 family metallopeptidase [Actinomycetota bacterium]MBU4359492.1 M23 family metallopeptidase [Actinomycetota bacterium]MBU4392882.1 M23 family metallopeptidase [Actinomycetota bacterium]